jgi:hypothetical protein
MNKRDMIERIRDLNPTATPEFLARFNDEDLAAYLRQLQELERDRRSRAERALAMSA